MNRQILGLSLLAGVCGLVSGCHDTPHQERIAYREEHLRRTCNLLADEEDRNCGQLAYTLNLLQKEHEDDVERTENLCDTLEDSLERDRDFHEKQRPFNEDNAAHVLHGDCDNAERTLPLILY